MAYAELAALSCPVTLLSGENDLVAPEAVRAAAARIRPAPTFSAFAVLRKSQGQRIRRIADNPELCSNGDGKLSPA